MQKGITRQQPTIVRSQSEYEAERLSQLQYGRKKLVLPSTSHSNGKKAMSNAPAPKKVQKTGHEACLAKVISERRKIEIRLINDTIVRGELLEFDRFTIRLRHADDTCMWYFKGAMIGFSEV
jgi:sRNA-binding regulator protein Hfq